MMKSNEQAEQAYKDAKEREGRAAEDTQKTRRHVTVLHGHPIEFARHTVRAAIAKESRESEPTES